MKLLIVTREREEDRRYGMGKSTTPLQSELERMGHAVRYLCQADRDAAGSRSLERIVRLLTPLVRGAPCRTILLRSALEAVWMGRLAAAAARRGRFTHVHCHDVLVALGLVISTLGKRRQFSWGITQHAFGSTVEAAHKWVCPLPTWLRGGLRRLESKLMRSADWVVAPTRAGLAQLATDLGNKTMPPTWHVIPHSLPQLNVCSKEEARSRLGWEPHLRYIVGVGQFIEIKRFPMLIAACARLKQDVQLVLLGEGDTHVLKDATFECGLRRPVIFDLTDNIALYLSAADLYVSASATESFGLANLEALVAGIPAVCTAVDAVPEVMGDCALLVEGDATALAIGMEKLIEHPDLAAELRRRALARAQSWPDAAATAKKYEQVYAAAASL